jgi:Tfp pilus assembly protein PilN
MAVAAPARKLPPTRARPAPSRAPQRVRPKPKRAPRGHLVPLAAARTAASVRNLPDSGLVVRMTRGRAWIGVLGVLLVGIVALNVVTLSFAASTGGIDENIQALDKENALLRNRDAQKSGIERIRGAAAAQGLVMPTADQVHYINAGRDDVATAAQRLAGAG